MATKKPKISKTSLLYKYKKGLVSKIIEKESPNRNDLSNFELVARFNEGKSQSEVYQIKCFFPEFSGLYILKISPENSWGEDSEETRYQNFRSMYSKFTTQNFVPHVSTFKIDNHWFTFWRSTFDVSISTTHQLNQEPNIEKTKSALKLTANVLLDFFNESKVSANKCTFFDICKNILDYRLDLVNGNIWSFVRDHLKIDYQSASFGWNKRRLSNPYYYALKANNIKIDFSFKSPCHGDCHSGNIFVDFTNDAASNVKFIDFALLKRNAYAFYDLAYLELSMAIAHDISLSENSNRWDLFLNSLASQISGSVNHPHPLDDQLKRKIDEVYLNFTEFAESQNHTNDLKKLYCIQRICAGLNFCNKPLTPAQRKFSFLYAAFHLEAYIDNFEDDSSISSFKERIFAHPDFLYHEELENIKEFETMWADFERNAGGDANRDASHLIGIFQKLKPLEKYNRKPTLRTLTASRIFPGFFFDHCKTSSDKEEVRLFSFLALSLNASQLNLKGFYDDVEFSHLLRRFYTINYGMLSTQEKIYWIDFSIALLNEYLITQNTVEFNATLGRIPINDASNEQVNQVKYYEAMLYASSFQFPQMGHVVVNWRPEETNSSVHWLVKKAQLLSLFYGELYNPETIKLFTQAYQRYILEPFNEQIQFLEAYSFFVLSKSWAREAFYTELKVKVQVIKSKYLVSEDGTHQAFQTFHDLISDLIEDRVKNEKIKIEPYEANRYKVNSTRYFGSTPEQERVINSIRILHLTKNFGVLLKQNHVTFISENDYYLCHINSYTYFPYWWCFLGYQYTGRDLEAKFFRRLAQDYVYEEAVANDIENIASSLQKHLQYLFSNGRNFNHEIILFISETLLVRDSKHWVEFFEFCWLVYAESRLLFKTEEIIARYIMLFFEKALLLMDDINIIKKCLLLCLEFNASEGWQINLLASIFNNPFVKDRISELMTSEVFDKIEVLISKLKNNVEHISKMLINISPLLNDKHREAILIGLESSNEFALYKSSYTTIVNLSRGNERVLNKIKSSILQEDLWPHGISLEENGFRRHIFADAIIPFHKLRRSQHFPNGILWTNDDVLMIFEAMINSLKVVEEYESRNQFGEKIESELAYEMFAFLNDNYEILKEHPEFQAIFAVVKTRYEKSIADLDFSEGLISDSDMTVAASIKRFQDMLLKENLSLIDKAWLMLLAKIATKAEPKLEYSIEFFSVWFEELRGREFLSIETYMHFYKTILNQYIEVSYLRSPFIQERLFKIARVLKYLGVKDSRVDKWFEIKNNSRYKTVKLMDDELELKS